MKIESKIGQVLQIDEKIFNVLTDFRNFKDLIPQDQVSDFDATMDTCSFSVPGIGKAGLRIIEREPNKLVKIQADETTKFDFTLWIQLKQVAESDTRIKITVEPQLNPMIEMMAKKPLKQFVDSLVDHIEKIRY